MTKPQLSATVAICTHNGASRLPLVLKALARQSMPEKDWEVLVIDNASTDETSAVCEEMLKGFRGVSCAVVHEARPGLSFARTRAAHEARGEFLLFLDDDNIPSPDWVAQAVEVFRRFPKAGVIGGKVLPQWEVPPTPLAEAVASFALAICDLGDEEQRIESRGGGIVGAGMCVRTTLLKEIMAAGETAAIVTDRTGDNLISGGDLAISIIARQKGWQCWYMPSMIISHCLPAARMNKEYLLRLYHGIGRGQAATRRIYDPKARSPLALLISLKDMVRWGKIKAKALSGIREIDTSSIDRHLRDLDRSLIKGRMFETLRFF